MFQRYHHRRGHGRGYSSPMSTLGGILFALFLAACIAGGIILAAWALANR